MAAPNDSRNLLTACLFLLASLSATQTEASLIMQYLISPPSTLGDHTMVPFPDDTRTNGTDVSGVPSPSGGTLAFDIDMNLREVGDGWASWGHGYTGDVYYSNGGSFLTMTLPAGTEAFYFYLAPTSGACQYTVTSSSPDYPLPLTLSVAALETMASGISVYSSSGETISSITVSGVHDMTTGDPVDFAVGQFGIQAVPEPASLAIFAGLGLPFLLSYTRRRRSTARANSHSQ